jgi:hypothetical protein
MSHNTSVVPRQREQIANEVGLLTVYDGRCCTGFLHRRGREGLEGYDAGNVSLAQQRSWQRRPSGATRMARGSHERCPPSRTSPEPAIQRAVFQRLRLRGVPGVCLPPRERRLQKAHRGRDTEGVQCGGRSAGCYLHLSEQDLRIGVEGRGRSRHSRVARSSRRDGGSRLDRALPVLEVWGLLRGRASGGAP